MTERDRVNVRALPVHGPGEAGQESGQEPWVGLTEAGRLTGRHPDALRAMIRRGKLQGRKNNAGQWLVQIPADMLAESDSADDPDMAGVVAELRDELLEAKVAAARAEAERDSAMVTLADARATIERERARGDRLEAELAAAMDAERTLVVRLEAALAEARRPWLAKVLEGLRRKGS